MQTESYNATITVAKPANEVFNAINNVANWWTENFEGSAQKKDDIFTIQFGGDTFVTHKLLEAIPGKKVEWLVTDCNLAWLKDTKEWNNTRMVFDISTDDNNNTRLHFTHIGIVPGIECYESCVKGWDQYVKGSLYKLITEGQGQPQKKVAAGN